MNGQADPGTYKTQTIILSTWLILTLLSLPIQKLTSPSSVPGKRTIMASTEDITHQAISSYFIGPRAENLDEFRNNISVILDEIQRAREKYFKEDVVRPASTPSILPHKLTNAGKRLHIHPTLGPAIR